MYASPSPLPEAARKAICASLRTMLIDGIDLHSQTKVAHWNIKGPQFAALHPLFDQFATDIATHNDATAERVLTLGELAVGTTRHVAKLTQLPDYPQEVTKDLDHVKLLADRIDAWLKSVRAARKVATEHGDDETVDLCNQVAQLFEKHVWFLRATLSA